MTDNEKKSLVIALKMLGLSDAEVKRRAEEICDLGIAPCPDCGRDTCMTIPCPSRDHGLDERRCAHGE
jgi:hypothetical protein